MKCPQIPREKTLSQKYTDIALRMQWKVNINDKATMPMSSYLDYCWIIWQYGLWTFQTGGTKLERFLPKNQHTQRKLLNFENWVSGEVSKSAKSPNLLTFKVNFLYQKLSESFSFFFSLKNINLGAHFLLLTFFDNINF